MKLIFHLFLPLQFYTLHLVNNTTSNFGGGWDASVACCAPRYPIKPFFLYCCCYFVMLLVATLLHCMCFGQVLLSSSLPCRWCIGAQSRSCSYFGAKYPPLSFSFCCQCWCCSTTLLMLLSVRCVACAMVWYYPCPRKKNQSSHFSFFNKKNSLFSFLFHFFFFSFSFLFCFLTYFSRGFFWLFNMNFVFFREISESNIKRSIFIFYLLSLAKKIEIFLIICKSFGKYLHFRLQAGFWFVIHLFGFSFSSSIGFSYEN